MRLRRDAALGYEGCVAGKEPAPARTGEQARARQHLCIVHARIVGIKQENILTD